MSKRIWLSVFSFFILAILTQQRSYAIVAAPIIVISLVKITVYLVGLIAAPVMAFFQLIEHKNRKVALIRAFLVVLGIGLLFFFGIHFLTGSKSSGSISFNEQKIRVPASSDVTDFGSKPGMTYEMAYPSLPAPYSIHEPSIVTPLQEEVQEFLIISVTIIAFAMVLLNFVFWEMKLWKLLVSIVLVSFVWTVIVAAFVLTPNLVGM